MALTLFGLTGIYARIVSVLLHVSQRFFCICILLPQLYLEFQRVHNLHFYKEPNRIVERAAVRSLTAVEGYKLADHKQNGDTGEQLRMTSINTATGTVEKRDSISMKNA